MTISLKSIELSNIRSHKHTFFEPAKTGITAISGPTGSGKSTIVDSLAWTLFGTKPSGVSRSAAIYRSGADFKTDKCYSRVELYVDNALFKIERRMVSKSGASESDIWEHDGDDWVHRAGTAVSHVEKYIREILKMDEKGFLTAILVQQKQVDQLIASGPRERAQVIEKLTGISSITEGLVMARQEYNLLRKNAQVSTIDESQLQTASDELLEKQKELKKLKKEYITGKEILIKEKTEGSKLKKIVKEESEKAESLNNARTRESQLEAQIELKEDALEAAIKEKDRLKKLVKRSSVGADFEESKNKVNELRKSVNKLTVNQTLKNKELSALEKDLNNHNKVISNSEFGNSKKVIKEIESLKKNIEKNDDEKDELQSLNSQLLNEVRSYENAITVLSDGDCPTCLQSVSDSDEAISTLKNKALISKESRKSNKEKIENIEVKLRDYRNDLEGLESVLRSLEKLSIVQEDISVIELELSNIDSDYKTYSTELKAVEKVHKELERHEENNRAYKASLERASTLATDIDKLKLELKEVKETIKNSGAISVKKLNKLRDDLFNMQNSFQDKRLKHEALKTQAQLVTKDIDHLKTDIVRYRKEIEKYTDLLASVEIASSTVQILDEFRGERMKTALPTIENYASELLTRFTDGKFTRLELDSKFNTSVALADGTIRPVGLLSGGELSAASIALRLSVSILLNSSARSMIILDEVLVSQDSDRSELILSTIKDVFQGQIIMISHNTSIDGIADKTVELAANL